ncbi:MAG: MFS transporter [Bacteroidetes bacterium]|nr:MFS transporter [Bacteroidota bacterium]
MSDVPAGSEAPGPAPSFFRSPLFPIFIIVVVDVFGFTLVLPLLPFYAEHLGATPLVVGLITASFAFCQFVAGPMLGRLSDRVGRRPVLLLSQVGTLVGFIILGFSGTLWLLFLSRIIDGITAGNLSIAQAYISDVTKPEGRTKAFGLIGIAFGVGFMLGPAISAFLSTFGYEWPAFAAALLSFSSILCTWFLLPDVKPNHDPNARRLGRVEQIASFFKRPLPRLRLLEFFCFVLSFSTVIGGTALFLERQFGYTEKNTGYIYAFSGLVGGLVQGGLLGRLVKRFGESRLATIGFIGMVLGYGLLGWTFGLPFLLVMIVVGAFGSAVARPALTALLTHSVGRTEQGAALGVSQSLQSIAQIIGPLIAGLLIEHHMLKTYGVVAGAFALLGVIFTLRHRNAGEGPPESMPAA